MGRDELTVGDQLCAKRWRPGFLLLAVVKVVC